MKALTCEMCGSTNLLKQDGVFVCQSCGTKYSVEEAKKMMVEGTVDVKGTVKVDNSGSIANFLMMAKNAESAGNNTEAESYCNRIIEITPQHSAAWFLKGKSAGWQTTLKNNRLEESINCFRNALSFSNDDEKENTKGEIIKETEHLCSAILNLACNHFSDFPTDDNVVMVLTNYTTILTSGVSLLIECGADTKAFMKQAAEIMNGGAVGAYNSAQAEYSKEEHPYEFQWRNFLSAGDNSLKVMNIVVGIDESESEDKIRYYKSMITMQQTIVNSCSYNYSNGGYVKEYSLTETAKNARIDQIMEWHQNIKNLDPNYTVPNRPSASSGCYVATAVYGSYDCPEVWTLRRFRDNTLAETWYGRAFIHTYYAISPTLVKWFGHTEWFKKMLKEPLDSLVRKLQSQGVENTPYNDRIW